MSVQISFEYTNAVCVSRSCAGPLENAEERRTDPRRVCQTSSADPLFSLDAAAVFPEVPPDGFAGRLGRRQPDPGAQPFRERRPYPVHTFGNLPRAGLADVPDVSYNCR